MLKSNLFLLAYWCLKVYTHTIGRDLLGAFFVCLSTLLSLSIFVWCVHISKVQGPYLIRAEFLHICFEQLLNT